MQDIKYKLTLCDGPSCIHSQSKQFRKAIEAELEKQGIADSTEIHLSGCLGMCKKGTDPDCQSWLCDVRQSQDRRHE
ncbi:MAG: hypothetical protein ACYSO2_00830 [Planctomycetota bacterium]